LLLGLPSHSSHLPQPLDVGPFGPCHHFYSIEVDNYSCTGQNIAGITKSVFIPFLKDARQPTFTPHNIRQSFTSTGIYPLNPRSILGKLNPKSVKRRDILRILKLATASHEIHHNVLATSQLLANLSLKDTHTMVDRITGIMRELGHQLEEEIPSNKLWHELSNKLPTGDRLYNQTVQRKLSEASLLDSAAIMKLGDARIATDEKKKKARLPAKRKSRPSGTPVRARKVTSKPKQKLPPACSDTPTMTATHHFASRANIITIAATPQVLAMDSAAVSSDDSEPEEISDSEWSRVIALAPPSLLTHPRSFSSSNQPVSPPALHMSLRTRKPPI